MTEDCACCTYFPWSSGCYIEYSIRLVNNSMYAGETPCFSAFVMHALDCIVSSFLWSMQNPSEIILLLIIVESNVFVSQYSVQNQTRKVLFGDALDFLTAIVVRIVSISLRRRRIPTGEVREQEKRKQVLANRWAILVVLVVVVMVVAVAESGTARGSGRR
mmetsp:Transcript_7674/g.19118  ORF Transcript_7674/g.19118 Transcript_7674/m.19118 type:complete len:161 (-) Transcript_7674:179-661(-)